MGRLPDTVTPYTVDESSLTVATTTGTIDETTVQTTGDTPGGTTSPPTTTG